jgi:hypothetical protein
VGAFALAIMANLATDQIKALDPSPWRDAVALALWPLAMFGVVLIVGLVAWRERADKPSGIAPSGQAEATRVGAPDLPMARRKAAALDELLEIEYDNEVVAKRFEDGWAFNPGVLSGPTLAMYRRRRYQRLGLADLFQPNPDEGRAAFQMLIDTYEGLAERPSDADQMSLPDQRRQLDDVAAEVIDAYTPNRLHAFRADLNLPGMGGWVEDMKLEIGYRVKQLRACRDQLRPS